jgi:hypothetical protein
MEGDYATMCIVTSVCFLRIWDLLEVPMPVPIGAAMAKLFFRKLVGVGPHVKNENLGIWFLIESTGLGVQDI